VRGDPAGGAAGDGRPTALGAGNSVRPRWTPLRVAAVSLAFIALVQALCVIRVHGGDWTGPFLVGAPGAGARWPLWVAMEPGSPGYDGQFELRLALDPFLSHGTVRGLDLPEYRARRILWPLLAFLIGFGTPVGALIALYLSQALLLAAGSWAVAALARDAGRSAAWGWAFPAGLGVVVCLWRMTGDGVMVALLLLALHAARRDRSWAAACLLAAATLQKETALLAAPLLLAAGMPSSRLRVAGRALVAMVPVFAWWGWVHAAVGGATLERVAFNFDVPGRGLLDAVTAAVSSGRAPLSVVKDLGFLALHAAAIGYGLACGLRALSSFARSGSSRRPPPLGGAAVVGSPAVAALARPVHLVAGAFALLGLCLGDAVWVEPWAYARSLLPLTTFCLLAGLVGTAASRPEAVPRRLDRWRAAGLTLGLGSALAGAAYVLALTLAARP
jgi:hypothetical protein